MKMIKRLTVAFGAAMIGVMAFAGGANAQAIRTWVSGVGDDANPCSRTAPCKTFAGAISKTAANGTINALDPGGFGAVTITKPISIVADGDFAGVTAVSGINGITIASTFAPTNGRVLLKGLSLEGGGTGGSGVRVVGLASVTLEDVTIRDFAQNGVVIDAPAVARVLLNRVTITNNAQNGVSALGANRNQVVIRDSFIDGNNIALNAGAAARVVITGSVFSGSVGGNDVTVASGAVVASYGDNVIRSGAPTTTLPAQ